MVKLLDTEGYTQVNILPAQGDDAADDFLGAPEPVGDVISAGHEVPPGDVVASSDSAMSGAAFADPSNNGGGTVAAAVAEPSNDGGGKLLQSGTPPTGRKLKRKHTFSPSSASKKNKGKK
jgi:hypothetical protein